MNLIADENVLAGVILIALVLVCIMLGIAAIAATVLRIMIFFSYWITNREKSSGGYTGATAAEKLLSELGYNDIAVRKCGFFAMLFYGNHYNPNKKTVFLRHSTYVGHNLTAVGLALQKVGLVIQDKRDGDTIKKRWKLQKLALFGPVLFIPIVIVGLIIDILTLYLTGGTFTGVATLICALLGVAFFIVCFVLQIMTIKTESKANLETLEIMKNYDFLNAYEQEKIAKVFKTYQLAYITDFIISILQIVKLILKVLLAIVKNKK